MYLKLLWAFFQIGLFSFGGGYAALPLIQAQVVDKYSWLTLTEFTDLITISQMTPGPIAINASSFVGYRLAGIPGAIVATLGNVLPSVIIVLTLAYIYNKYRDLVIVKDVLSGLRPAVIALITAAGLSMLNNAFWGEEGVLVAGVANIDGIAVGVFVGSLLILRKFKWDPVLVMVLCGLIGGGVYYFM